MFSMTEHMENRNVTFKQCPPPVRKCTVNASSTDESDDICRTDTEKVGWQLAILYPPQLFLTEEMGQANWSHCSLVPRLSPHTFVVCLFVFIVCLFLFFVLFIVVRKPENVAPLTAHAQFQI